MLSNSTENGVIQLFDNTNRVNPMERHLIKQFAFIALAIYSTYYLQILAMTPLVKIQTLANQVILTKYHVLSR